MAATAATSHAAPVPEGPQPGPRGAASPEAQTALRLHAVPVPDWEALAARMRSRRDEIVDLMSLLGEHADPAAGPGAVSEAIAWAIACASLGDQHLWQDLRLPSRRELSALFEHWFPSLAAKNTQNMKWKKFLYKQLCLREELLICKAPSCGVCSDHGLCFDSEDAPAA
jgi:nitrogen fixation protein NifQ